MISTSDYFGAKPHSDAERELAEDLLARVNALLVEAEDAGAKPHICPNTGTEISGSLHGAGDGGFRLPDSTTGSARSSHKEARAVDVYDPSGAIDAWLDTF